MTSSTSGATSPLSEDPVAEISPTLFSHTSLSFAVVIALLFLTPLLTYIPKAGLAALVISAVLTLFHPKEVFKLWNMFVNADEVNRPSCPQILQLRSDNTIFFANAEYTVDNIIKRMDEQTTPLKFLLLDF